MKHMRNVADSLLNNTHILRMTLSLLCLNAAILMDRKRSATATVVSAVCDTYSLSNADVKEIVKVTRVTLYAQPCAKCFVNT